MKSSQHESDRSRPGKAKFEDRPGEPLFGRGPRLRRLRVLIDCDSPNIKTPGKRVELLLGLLRNDSVSSIRFSDHNAPTSVPKVEAPYDESIQGWVLLVEDGQSFTVGEGDSVAHYGLRFDDAASIAESDTSSRSYPDLDATAAAKQRFLDMQLLHIADALEVDLLITEREYLLGKPFGWSDRFGVEVLNPEDALPIVGLYLRQQEEYIVWADPKDKITHTFNRGLMYWVASRSLLPEGWRWMTACVQHSSHQQQDLLTHYAGTAHHRLERAIRSRDALFVAMNQPQNNDTADDALEALDNLLIALSSAMDVVARVLHYVLHIQLPVHQVGWRRRRWLEAIEGAAPDIADLMNESRYGDLVLIVGALRNTVHGAALQPIAISSSEHMKRTDTVVGLPAEQLDELLVAMDRLGGHDAWGVKELIPGRAHADLDVLCERLMTEVPKFLNEAMSLTPVEQLAGVQLQPENLAPPEDPRSPFRETNRQYILWQVGLEERA